MYIPVTEVLTLLFSLILYFLFKQNITLFNTYKISTCELCPESQLLIFVVYITKNKNKLNTKNVLNTGLKNTYFFFEAMNSNKEIDILSFSESFRSINCHNINTTNQYKVGSTYQYVTVMYY